MLLNISHGYVVKSSDDPIVQLFEDVHRVVAETTAPGAFAIDSYSIRTFAVHQHVHKLIIAVSTSPPELVPCYKIQRRSDSVGTDVMIGGLRYVSEDTEHVD